MSVKKILSIIMALAIVLTMASFPAFAAEPVAIIAAHGNLTIDGSKNVAPNAYDGDLTTKFVPNQYKGSTANGTYAVVFELENTVTLDTLTINWGGSAWGLTGPDKYNVYVSADNAEYEQILTYEGLYTKDTAPANYPGLTYVTGSEGGVNVTYDMVETGLNKANVKFIKIETKRWNGRPTFREIAVTGTLGAAAPEIPEDPKPEVKEDTVEALGANIRLATETVSAGLRFGATVNKADLLIEGDYVYDEASDVQLGMYLLPAEMLAESETLEDYIAAGKPEVLDVPAKKVYAQDDETITFTAVLVDIPAEAYAKEIVAVPYVKVAEDVTYFEEKDQSYTGVAQAAFDANEAGTITLTEDQLKALKDILGIEDEPEVPEEPEVPAEPVKATIVSYSSTSKFQTSQGRGLDMAFDGDWNTSFKYNAWFSASVTKGSSGSIKIDMELDGSYNISTLTMAQDPSSNKYYFTKFAVYGSNDNATWTEIADFTNGVPEKTDYAISHEGTYKYVRFEGYNIKNAGSPVVFEIELYGIAK